MTRSFILKRIAPPCTSRAVSFVLTCWRTPLRLNKLGIDGRDLVVIAHTQNLESIYAFWGAIVAGAIPSMFPTLTEKLDPDIYLHSMAELARLSNVRAILTTDDFAPQMRAAVPCPVYASQQLAESVSESLGS